MRYIFESENQLRYELHNQSNRALQSEVERDEVVREMKRKHKAALEMEKENHINIICHNIVLINQPK